LKNDSDFSIEIFEVVFAKVHSIEEHLPFYRIVKPSHQLNQRGLAFAVFTHKRNSLAGTQVKIQVAKNEPVGSRIPERYMPEVESVHHTARNRQCRPLRPQ